MNLPSLPQALAFGRNVFSYAAGAVTVAAGWHLVSTQDANSLTTALNQISSGITSLAGGIATIATVGAGVWAAYTASRAQQVQSVAGIPGTTVVTTPDIAKATPQSNVVSNAENKVVAKPIGTPSVSL